MIGMAVASLYEVLEAYRTRQAVPGWSTLGILVLLCLTCPAMVLAANGAVFPTPILRGSPFAGFRALRRWLVHYENFVASAVMALAAAILYACLHYQIAVAR